jgi:hypothetical protein
MSQAVRGPDDGPGDAFEVTIRIIRQPGMTRDGVLSHIINSVRHWTTTDLKVTPVVLDPDEAALLAELKGLLP